jgi:hypothetical protein
MNSSSEVSEPSATNLKQTRNPKLIGERRIITGVGGEPGYCVISAEVEGQIREQLALGLGIHRVAKVVGCGSGTVQRVRASAFTASRGVGRRYRGCPASGTIMPSDPMGLDHGMWCRPLIRSGDRASGSAR